MQTSISGRHHALGIRHPVIQGPFGGGLSTVALAALVSNAGGLGSFGAHSFPPERIASLVSELAENTREAFAVNLWVSDHDAGAEAVRAEDFERVWSAMRPWFEELGLAQPDLPSTWHPKFDEQMDALLEARPPVFSFVFGIPSTKQIDACKARGILTIGAATTLAEARAIEAAGIDAVVVTGMEAGGHRPSFLESAEQSLHGTFALTQLASAHLSIPVIAAGGIHDATSKNAALLLGAAAVQIGTAFLACRESGTDEQHRTQLFARASERTLLTRSFSGRLARGLRNTWTDSVPAGAAHAPFPIQSWFTAQMRKAALAQGRVDLISLWGGQIAPLLKHRSAHDLMAALVAN